VPATDLPGQIHYLVADQMTRLCALFGRPQNMPEKIVVSRWPAQKSRLKMKYQIFDKFFKQSIFTHAFKKGN
jgi:hypothetical protein